jgi:hypothetical protein
MTRPMSSFPPLPLKYNNASSCLEICVDVMDVLSSAVLRNSTSPLYGGSSEECALEGVVARVRGEIEKSREVVHFPHTTHPFVKITKRDM